jgi:NDP-sugar pyrophosphorylase family protein
MKAIVLAGGKGTRLLPYTALIPKPLMPIGDMTIVEILLRQLAFYGARDVMMCTGHQAALIEAVLGDGSRYGVKLSYRREDQPLGTIGPLRALLDELPERFLVMNGDILANVDFSDLYRASEERSAALSVAVYERPMKIDLGVLDLDADGSVVGFREKPTIPFWVSMGIYVLSREALRRFVPPNEPFGFDQLMHAMLSAREPIHTYPFRGHWLDIGRSDDFSEAQGEFEKNRPLYLPGERG